MTDRLGLYNGALLMLGSRRLRTLTDDVESRYVLDTIWDNNGVKRCLQHGYWKHAMRTMKLDYDPDFVTQFGFHYVFDMPDDLVRLYSICSDEFFTNPVSLYQDDGQQWYCDFQEIYVRYVSNDQDYGMDMSKWPESFTEYVEGYFALKAIKRLTDAKVDADDLKTDVKNLKIKAKSEDALREPVGLVVPSGWSIARSHLDYGRRRQHPYR